jgi:L-asparagine transporter-like permease
MFSRPAKAKRLTLSGPSVSNSNGSNGVPRAAILNSTVIGFLCMIVAAVSPDRVFLFLLNSSGAIILFVYLLIAISHESVVIYQSPRLTAGGALLPG